jgi:hypothetical protein
MKIAWSCPGLNNKIEGLECDWEDHPEWYYENGKCFKLRFKGIHNSPGQFVIKDSATKPLGGTNMTLSESTVLPYNNNLFYTPIPFEHLRTYEEKP